MTNWPGEVPYWLPRTEAEIAEAAALGLLEENHHLDVKREIPAGAKANRELARDLASFAIDGGMLIIGIGDVAETGSFSLIPQPLKGLAERVELIARTVPDPPLAVLSSPVRSAHDHALGYLVVRVPQSATAPHMVDHRYIGRGDKTKLYLSDADVRRLHQLRRATEQDALMLLQPRVRLKGLLSPNLENLSLGQVRQGHRNPGRRRARLAGPLRVDRQGETPRRPEPAGQDHRVPAVRAAGPRRLSAFYDWCAQNDTAPELVTLATTISRWKDETTTAVLTGVTNATSESLNRVAELEARMAWSFRNPEN